MSYVVKNHPEKEALRQEWMKSKDPMSARAGWALTAGRVAREPEGLDIPALRDRIENEMADPRGATDHEQHAGRDRHSPREVPQARHGHRRVAGNLPRLPGLEGLHVAVRAGSKPWWPGRAESVDGTC